MASSIFRLSNIRGRPGTNNIGMPPNSISHSEAGWLGIREQPFSFAFFPSSPSLETHSSFCDKNGRTGSNSPEAKKKQISDRKH